ncbi:hypothetical protein BH20ACT18_BH20ACT18_13700 [soil metagenome]
MKRTTVKIPNELDARLRYEAQRRGTTISEITRAALDAHLGGGAGRPQRRLSSAGAGAGDGSDVARRFEEILSEEGFGEDT